MTGLEIIIPVAILLAFAAVVRIRRTPQRLDQRRGERRLARGPCEAILSEDLCDRRHSGRRRQDLWLGGR
ncbi:MAG: hypothetical protein AAGE01_12210 [Pseudomonadota bacterium]